MEKGAKKIKKSEEDFQRESMHREGYWIAEWQLKLFDALRKYQEVHNLNQTELSDKFGVTKGYISQVLSGNFNHKIATLIKLALAAGKAPVLSFEDLESYIENDILGVHQLPKEEQKSININIVHNHGNTNMYIVNQENSDVTATSNQAITEI